MKEFTAHLRKLFTKKQVLTLPNLFSILRLALIPVIVVLHTKKYYYAAVGTVLLSAVTDVVDGQIARRLGMTSELGKILDPIADKLTQTARLLCLLNKHPSLWILVVLFAVGEISKLVLGTAVITKCNEVSSAKWYGKLNTVILYGVALLLILFQQIDARLVQVLILLCGAVMLMAHLLYIFFYIKCLRTSKRD